MLLSLALIIITGFALKAVFEKLRLPGLLGMLLAGVLLGPFAAGLISGDILAMSGDLRKMALIVILIKAGLSVDLKDLRNVGRPALLLCFVPAAVGAIPLAVGMPAGATILTAAVLAVVITAPLGAILIDTSYKKLLRH